MAFEDGVEEMQGNDKAVYQAAIKVLYNTLKSATANLENCKDNLNTLTL